MQLAWIVFILVALCACADFKKTVIIWMACRLLFNAQVALRYAAPAMSLDFGVAILLILLYFVRGNGNGLARDKFYLKPILIATLLSYFFSTIFSIYFVGEGYRVLIKLIVSNFAIIYVFQKVLNNIDDVRLFVMALVIVAIIISVLGIYESTIHDNPYLDYIYFNSPQEGTEGRMYYIPPSIRGNLTIRYGMVRAYSTFGIHISFGCACAFLLGFFLIIIQKRWLKVNKWLMTITIVILITGCVTSNSKTAYLGMMTMLLLLVRPRTLLNIKTILIILSIVIAVIIAYEYVPGYFNNILSLFDEDMAEEGGGSTIATRQRQLDMAMEFFRQNPLFGNGPGSLMILRQIGEGSDILGAEGAHLTILPERGVLGYMIYLFTFVYFFITSKRIIPSFFIFIFLLALFVMEIASGLRDMTLYYSLLIALRRIYQLDNLKVKRKKSQINFESQKEIMQPNMRKIPNI